MRTISSIYFYPESIHYKLSLVSGQYLSRFVTAHMKENMLGTSPNSFRGNKNRCQEPRLPTASREKRRERSLTLGSLTSSLTFRDWRKRAVGEAATFCVERPWPINSSQSGRQVAWPLQSSCRPGGPLTLRLLGASRLRLLGAERQPGE